MAIHPKKLKAFMLAIGGDKPSKKKGEPLLDEEDDAEGSSEVEGQSLTDAASAMFDAIQDRDRSKFTKGVKALVSCVKGHDEPAEESDDEDDDDGY